MKEHRALRLALGICMVTGAVNLHAPLYERLATSAGLGLAASTVAFACYVAGVLPVLLGLGGLAERLGYRVLCVAALALSLAATLSMLVVPSLLTLGVARWMLGLATGLISSVASAYMQWLWRGQGRERALLYVTLSSALGFGLGAALTSAFLLYSFQASGWSSWLLLVMGALSLVGVATLPDKPPADQHSRPALFRLPAYPSGTLVFGVAILLAWSTVGMVIAILPAALGAHGLTAYSGFVVLGVCSAGILFQPMARRLAPHHALQRGLLTLPLAYAFIVTGTLTGKLWVVLPAAVAASSACYGFIYLGGLSGVMARAGEQTTRASAGYFLLAYVGFSLPVVATGLLVDALGYWPAFVLFGAFILVGSALTMYRINRRTMPEAT